VRLLKRVRGWLDHPSPVKLPRVERDHAPQPVSAEQFKLAMRSLAATVNVVTSAHSGHRYGMTATAACSVSADPPTVLVCINKSTATHGAIAKSGAFCVNVLRAEDRELSSVFSGAQSGESRFKARDWTRLATGSPALIDALVSFDCRVVRKVAQGTHTVFFGEVEQLLFGKKGKPLLYAEGQYAKLTPILQELPPEGLEDWGLG
jgi:flavin reductase (DIM6/NTAB) family NADH-FMN oxidoreductase RutF